MYPKLQREEKVQYVVYPRDDRSQPGMVFIGFEQEVEMWHDVRRGDSHTKDH